MNVNELGEESDSDVTSPALPDILTDVSDGGSKESEITSICPRTRPGAHWNCG